MTDAILLLCHMGDVVNYEPLKVARTKPSGTDWAFDFMSDVRDMQEPLSMEPKRALGMRC